MTAAGSSAGSSADNARRPAAKSETPAGADRSPPRPAGKILVGCYRGMGDLLYVSSILGQMREETPPGVGIDLAAGAGVWADSVRHLPYVDRVIPVNSWDEIGAIGSRGYDRTLMGRVSNWMPFTTYRGWTLRARIERLHLVDVLARTLSVRLKPEHRRPVYFFDPADPEDDPAEAAALGRYAVISVHAFTQSQHNLDAETRLLKPLLDLAARAGHRLVIVGPPPAGARGGSAGPLPPSALDLRGAPIRRVATFIDRAELVVSVMNGMAVLADALRRPLLLIALGRDPVNVVGPVMAAPIEILGRTGRAGVDAVDVGRLVEIVDRKMSAG